MEAPDFTPGYPSKGERIGPAWRHTWNSFAGGEWRKGQDVAQQIAAGTGLAVSTIKNLLRDAAKAGHLEVELRFQGKVGGYTSKSPAIRASWYRRPK